MGRYFGRPGHMGKIMSNRRVGCCVSAHRKLWTGCPEKGFQSALTSFLVGGAFAAIAFVVAKYGFSGVVVLAGATSVLRGLERKMLDLAMPADLGLGTLVRICGPHQAAGAVGRV